MDSSLVSIILSYIQSNSRNKIIFFKVSVPDISPIDIGKLLSQALFNYKDENRLPMRSTMELEKILNKAITEHPRFGRVLAIANLGILFEPDLMQNFSSIIDNYSKNNTLFVAWKGEIDNNTLYFQTKEKGIKININNISHITV